MGLGKDFEGSVPVCLSVLRYEYQVARIPREGGACGWRPRLARISYLSEIPNLLLRNGSVLMRVLEISENNQY